MRAIEYTAFGGPEVLRLVDVPVPEPGPGQVRVAVKVAAVNGVDWKIREGHLGHQSMPQRPGVELAGIVDAAGPGASAEVGDEVFGWTAPGRTQVPGWDGGFPAGGYADFALAEAVITKPPAFSWTDAASLPVVGETAMRGVAWLDPQPGEVVLIQGGSGMVGSIAVQLAVARGATVIATTGQSNADYVASLGAIPVPYGDEMVEHVRKVSSRVDGAIDAAGLGALSDLVTLRGSTDRVVSLADPAAIEVGLPFLPGGPDGHNVHVLAELAEMVLNGAVKLRTAKIYPLSEAAVAQEINATGHAGGKVLLEVSP
jgi:NADPH:quinone reductase-like Zn-dependent oxidoreductase